MNKGKVGLQLRSLACPRDALPEIGQLELGSVRIKFQFFRKLSGVKQSQEGDAHCCGVEGTHHKMFS